MGQLRPIARPPAFGTATTISGAGASAREAGVTGRSILLPRLIWYYCLCFPQSPGSPGYSSWGSYRMFIRRVRTATLALATITGLSLSGLSPAPLHAAGTVTIGVVADITGASSVYGTSIRNGAKLAASLLNKAGGVDGNTVNIKLGDAASSKTQVIDLYPAVQR